MAVRGVAAALFVGMLVSLLALPILQSGGNRPSAPASVAPTSVAPTSVGPTPASEETEGGSGALRTRALPLARTCAPRPRLAARRPRPNLIATRATDGVTLRTTDGALLRTIGADAPVAWSATGLLATGPTGKLWTQEGDRVERGEVQLELARSKDAVWGWSPAADCAAIIEDGRLSFSAFQGIPPAGAVWIEEGTRAFSFSPDGTKIAIVISDARLRTSLWIGALNRQTAREVVRFPRGVCCVTLDEWAPSSSEVFFWAGSGASVMADGAELRSVDLDGHRSKWGTTLPRAETTRWCGERLLALTGGDRFQETNRISELLRDHASGPLTSRGTFDAFTCSPQGDLISDTNRRRLELRDANGAFMTFLTITSGPNGPLGESDPEWGPPGTGLVLRRAQHLVTMVWFVAEGGNVRSIEQLQQSSRRLDPSTMYDWSATPPTGLPAG